MTRIRISAAPRGVLSCYPWVYWVACIVLFGIAVWPSSAAAQAGAAAAEALFTEGRSAMDRNDYEVACTKFRESLRLDPAVGTELNLADCEERRGKIATAWVLFRQAAGRMAHDDFRLATAEERARKLEPRLPKLQLVASASASDELSVTIGELKLSKASLGSEIPLDPGRHKIVVASPGAESQIVEAELSAGKLTRVTLPELQARASNAPTDPLSSAETDSSDSGSREISMGEPDRTWAYVAGGVGIAGLAVGTVFGLLARSNLEKNDKGCEEGSEDCVAINQAGKDAQTQGIIATAGFVVGGVGLGVGTYLFFTAEPSSDSAAFSIGWRGVW